MTQEELEKIESGIFQSGINEITDPWNYGKKIMVRWVAVRGTIADWAIYHSYDSNITEYFGFGKKHYEASDRMIADHGAKLHDRKKIFELVPCDKDMEGTYRD